MHTKEVFAYIRVSTDKQAKEGNGLDAQRNGINAYCERKNYFIKEWFIDGGYSADSFDRPRLQDMLTLVKSKDIKDIIIYKRDRICRDVVDLFTEARDLIVKYNCTIEIALEGQLLKLHTSNDQFFAGVITLKDQIEILQVSERTKDGLDASAAKGNYIYAYPPFGYTKEKGCKRIIPIENRIEDVKFLFNSLANGDFNINSLTHHLNSTKFCNRHWTSISIRHILNNPIYYGTFITKRKVYENHTVPIIDKELFDQCQKSIAMRRRRSNVNHYTFDKKIICACCNNPAIQLCTNKPAKTYLYYVCKTCNKRINEDFLINTLDMPLNKIIAENNTKLKELVNLQEKIVTNKKMIDKLNTLYVENAINAEFLMDQSTMLAKENMQLNSGIEDLKKINKLRFMYLSRMNAIRFIKKTIVCIKVNFNTLDYTIIEKENTETIIN